MDVEGTEQLLWVEEYRMRLGGHTDSRHFLSLRPHDSDGA